MEAIEKIVEQLNHQAKMERHQLQERETARIDQEFQAELAEMKSENDKRLEKSLIHLENNYKQAMNRQQVNQKQTILNQKQTILERVFNESVIFMEALSPQTQQEFAQNALKKMNIEGEIIFIPGEKSQALFSKEWLDEQNKKLIYQLVLGEERIADQAGFILNKEGVQYNFLYQSLVREIQQRESFQIARSLFD